MINPFRKWMGQSFQQCILISLTESFDMGNIRILLIEKASYRRNRYDHSKAKIYDYPEAVVDERQKSQFKKRKRNLKTISPISRGEREIWIPCHSFEKRKGNLKSTSLISRGEREIWIPFPQFREEKEKSDKIFSTFEKRKRNFIYISTISRREREYWNSFLLFRE